MSGGYREKVPVSEILEKLASFNMTTRDHEMFRFQFQDMVKPSEWIVLGERHGIEYGISTFQHMFLKPDVDREKHVPIPLKTGEVEVSQLATRSLHRLVGEEPPDPATPTSNSPSPLTERIPWDSFIAESTKETGNNSHCELVLSRFFEVGNLILRRTKTGQKRGTQFVVVKALGPPECEGLWIIGDVPWVEETLDDTAAPLYTNLDGSEGPLSDEYLAQMRADRTAYLEGFPQPFSYARIKPSADRKEFDLIDPVKSNFVISDKVWLA
ncbi:MAG: hypothetical protein M1820_007198 [Bogoriella megaspora]|nr:MAG: hypothetical protein M1820_007198 [Bogoriella megaspora]